ncbi:hypothetical protein Bbelb_425050 [Branchiostoma belcheri]|nr:hypothetical protein Bbelb_425050 [Branchiostoma belcheri]
MIKTAIASFMNSHNGRAQPSIIHRAGRLHAGEEVLTSNRTPAGTQVELGQPRAEDVTNSSGVEVFAQNLGNRNSNASPPFPLIPVLKGRICKKLAVLSRRRTRITLQTHKKPRPTPVNPEFAATPMSWVPATRCSECGYPNDFDFNFCQKCGKTKQCM